MMCGIYGAIGNKYKHFGDLMLQSLRHRGPDDSGRFFDHQNELVLGHTRLSIIDLSNHSHQPMQSETGDYVLSFNGEIYNYKEIKEELIVRGYSFKTNSDTEVVLNSYIEWGKDSLHKFRGMFAFCIYDKTNEELFLARDRFGIKPLIYTFVNNQFVFCSELSPLLKANAISKKLSIDGISEYFRYGSIQQPNTIFAEAYYLMPGHFMRVNTDKSCTFEQYYDYATRGKIAVQEYSYQEAVGNLRRELDIATQYHLVSDVNVGAFLSGGVDSSAVVAMMKRSSTAQVNTFSIGFKHASEVEDETDIASRTAKYLGCNHRNIKIDDAYVSNIFDGFIDSLDQPTIDGINTFIVSLETAKEMKVALSGLGGDEIFAGYSHFSQITESSNISNKSHLVLLKKLHDLRPNRFTNRFQFVGISPEQGVDEKRVLDRQLSKTLKNHAMIEGLSKSMELSTIQRISKAEIDGYMLNTLLRDNDVLSMANSLEVRPILLDHKVVEAVFMLPDNFKIRNNLSKAIFIDSVKDMIPEEVWRREKSGFDMPLGHWMNSCLNVKFVQLMELPIAKEIFCARYRMKLSSRVLAKKAIRNDWMAFIFLAWAERHEVEI